MKKNNLFLAWLLTAVIAMLEFSSCSNELAPEKPVREGMVDVVMTTSLPEVLRTYGSNSADGGLKNLEGAGLYLRYVLEIYTESGDFLKRKLQYIELSSTKDYRSMKFSARLFAAKYTFVFWADIVRKVAKPEGMALEGLSSPFFANAYFFTNTYENGDVFWRPTGPETAVRGDLQAICASEIAETITPISPEMYDCYYCTQEVDITTEPTDIYFTLKRPFAKLRLISDGGGTTQRTPDYSKTVALLKSGSTIPTMFNAKEHTFSNGGDDNRGYWASVRLPIGLYNNESGNEHTLGVFYLPASGNPGSYNLELYFDVYELNTGNIISENVHVAVPNVPLEENRLTTIKGKLLANIHDIYVDIEDEFDNDGYWVTPGSGSEN